VKGRGEGHVFMFYTVNWNESLKWLVIPTAMAELLSLKLLSSLYCSSCYDKAIILYTLYTINLMEITNGEPFQNSVL
jgi:hypothetical protein